jgi:anti-anti-sigma regulatory factor
VVPAAALHYPSPCSPNLPRREFTRRDWSFTGTGTRATGVRMPELTITVSWPSADAPEVRIAGDLDAASAGRVRMSIVSVVLDGVSATAPRWCIVDLTQVTSIDAAGIEALLVAGRCLGEHGVMMRTHNSWAVDRAMHAAPNLGADAFDPAVRSMRSARRGWFRTRRHVTAVRSGAHWARS